MEATTSLRKDSERELRENLYKILLEEVSAYDYLSEIVGEKKEAIVKNDFRRVEELTGIEQVLGSKIDQLTRSRQENLRSLFKLNGRQNSPVTLSNFIGQMNKERRNLWDRIYNRLNVSIEKVRRDNADNQRLIQVSLDYIQGMIEMIYPRDKDSGMVYNKKGKDAAKMSKNLVNCNA